MKTRLAAVFCLIACMQAIAKRDTIPSWLDTLPPVVQIQPKEKYHQSVFHITFKANKQATFWFRVASPSGGGKEMAMYRDPITVTDEGSTRVYFYGEDLIGNKSRPDSMTYVLDSRPPEIVVTPQPGRYRGALAVHCAANKPCRFLFLPSLIDTAGKTKPIADSIAVKDSLSGYFVAMDSAGNSTVSARMTYIVDSTTVRVEISPKEGIYNTRQAIAFSSVPSADVYFTFDPSAPPRLFMHFDKPVLLPYGNTIVRFYARNSAGAESEIGKSTFVVDTLSPRIRFEQNAGAAFDTLILSTKKPTTIRYTLDGTFPNETSPVYTRPIVVQRKGKCVLKAVAKDLAGNRSELLEWEYIYDKTPPSISLSKQGGIYSSVLRVLVQTNKPASVFYTLDGSPATQNSVLYKDGIPITREGATVLRIIAKDDAGNTSPEAREEYTIDTKPPFVKVRVEEDVTQNAFLIELSASEEATIRYETDNRWPTESSPVYKDRLPLHMGQVLRYFAVDRAGNRSEMREMNDLTKPIVTAAPAGGLYRKSVKISFSSNPQSSVYFRLLPDTAFTRFTDSLVLSKEGTFTLEYFSQSPTGLKSPLRRSEYVLDLTPPITEVIVKKGNKDSVSVFFECSKRATIYYTLDGSNPAFSSTTRTAGNKFLLSKDRISIQRKNDVRLAYFTEDAAGNQSPIRVLDVFKPAAVPDVPAGAERVYDHILSVTLNTFDSKSVVHYARHGHVPTMDSLVFNNPITLASSDTIMAFAVDAAGYRGQLDTFVYLIDLPPSPEFTWAPSEVVQGTTVVFDASPSIDMETPKNRLLYRWDFNGDGIFDTDFRPDPRASYRYTAGGVFRVTLEVKDEMKRTTPLTKEILVQQLCPPGMVSKTLDAGTTFCIDTYEWPNIAGEKPLTSVSWVQAKIFCMDAGKRLCTTREWVSACRTSKKTEYPYGQKYQKGKCPVEGKSVYKSGAFPQCGEAAGPKDMAGNVWEWVEDKKGDYPYMLGGSFRFGEAADCHLASEGGVGLKSGEVGFRCCK